MPINVAKKKNPKPETTPDKLAAEAQAEIETEQASYSAPAGHASAPSAPSTPPVHHGTGAPHLMTGQNQRQEVEQSHALASLRSKLMQGAHEFFLKPGEHAKVYFLDGTLIGDGVFDTPMVHVHMEQIGGRWRKFVCPKGVEGRCVVCESGSNPQTVQLFTVINTMPYQIRNGPRAGTTLPARLQLFAASMKAREKMLKRAQKNDGRLAGGLFECSRSDQMEPRVGGDFEHVQNVPYEDVLAKYPMLGSRRDANGKFQEAPTAPLDYAHVYPILTNPELSQLRPDWGSYAGVGGGTGSGGSIGPGPEVDDSAIPFITCDMGSAFDGGSKKTWL